MHFDPIRTQIRGQPQSFQSTQSFLSGPTWTYPFWSGDSHFCVCAFRSRVLKIRVVEKRDFQTAPHSIDFMWTKGFTAKLTAKLCFKIKLFFRLVQYTWNAQGLLVDWVYTIHDVGTFFCRLRDVCVFRRSFLSVWNRSQIRRLRMLSQAGSRLLKKKKKKRTKPTILRDNSVFSQSLFLILNRPSTLCCKTNLLCMNLIIMCNWIELCHLLFN